LETLKETLYAGYSAMELLLLARVTREEADGGATRQIVEEIKKN
jgi:hypothetical protein